MNQRESNYCNMIRTTIEWCDDHTSDTSGILAFAPALADAKNKLLLIDQLNQVAVGSTKGVSLDALKLRKVMCQIGAKCSSALQAYSASVKNHALLASIKFSFDALMKKKIEEVANICQLIQETAVTNSAQAMNYGMAATDPADLLTAINLYRKAISSPRQALISISGAKARIREIRQDVVRNVFRGLMDPMVNTLTATNVPMVRGYFMSRRIVRMGHTTGKIRGTVRDGNDNTVNGVVFTVRKAGTMDVVGKDVSKNGGRFGVSHLFGDYDLVWELEGKIVREEKGVHVAAGKELKRRVRA